MNMFQKTRLNSHIRTMLFLTGWSKFCLGSQFTVFVTLCFTLRATFAFDAVSLFLLLSFCCIRLEFFTSTSRWTCICCFLFPFHFETPFVFFTPFGPAKLSESLSWNPYIQTAILAEKKSQLIHMLSDLVLGKNFAAGAKLMVVRPHPHFTSKILNLKIYESF